MKNPLNDRIDNYFIPAADDHIAREKSRARELRRSQWWKNVLGQGRCHYCRLLFRSGELTMDHIVPIVRGGKSTKRNVVPACKECNNKKSYLLPVEWAEYLKRISESQ